MKDKELESNLKALANRRRLAIVRFIKKSKEASVGDIADEIKLSFKSTSRHLSVLFSAGLLDREQRSLQVFYKLAPDIDEPVRRVVAAL
ncbi:MAG: metalloregulator ArsR/SmtB family transcription factor [Patescibacteria group bacterium]